jgi:hypothetical protein
MTPVVAQFLLAALSGCSSDGGETAANLDSFPLLAAEADMRIGDFDDPDLGFSRVTQMDVDEQGNLYVLEGLVPEIRVFTPDGTLIRRIGKRGEGPGEFQSAPLFGVVGDTVWAVENGANRITLFDREGYVLTTGRTQDVVVPLPTGFGYVLPWRMRPDGKFTSKLARIVGMARDTPGNDVSPSDSIPVPFVLFNANGAVTDTVGWAGHPPPRMWRPPSLAGPTPKIIDVGGRQAWVPSPPTPLPLWLTVLDGYITVETPMPGPGQEGVVSVTRIGLHGDTVYTRDFRYPPAPYTSEDLDSIAVWAARGEPGGMAPYMPGQGPPSDWEVVARYLRGAMEFPEYQLPFEYPWLAQDEGIWMRRTEEGSSSTVRWALLDPQGRPRGQLRLPRNLRVIWNRGDTFWAVEPDEYEVPWVVRFRIRPGE